MNKAAVLHVPKSQYSFAYGKKELRIRLRAAKSDLDKVEIIYAVKYDWLKDRKTKVMQNSYKEYTDKNEILEHLDGYYDTFKSWASEFATANHERKKMIICKLIDRIEIGKDYDIRVKMNINYEQFL